MTVQWTPIRLGHGNSFTSHASFEDFLDTSTKDMAKSNLLCRVDVNGGTDRDDAKQERSGPVIKFQKTVCNSCGRFA